MSTTLIVILASVAAVGLFVLGMSLTLIFKGHNIDSEISTNKNMQQRGIKCAVQQTREIDEQLRGDKGCDTSDELCSGSCGSCERNEK